MTAPTTSSRSGRIVAACLVFVAAFLVQIIAWDNNLNSYDEGIILTGADAVYHGRLPYKDFWTMYAPGQFYLTALAFHLFEPQEYLARGIGIFFMAAIVALVWHMLRRFVGKLLAALGTGIVLLLFAYLHFEVFPVFPATAFALLALLLVARGMARHQSAAMLYAGMCTAAAACFRHDLGAYAAVALMAGACITGRALQPASTWCSTARALAVYMAGIFIVGTPVAAYFLAHVPLHDLYENLIYIPARIYPEFRRLPWPGVEQMRQFGSALLNTRQAFATLLQGATTFSVYIPFAAAVPSIMLARSVRRQGDADTANFLLLCALLCLAFTFKGMVRIHLAHMMQALVLSIPLLAILARRLPHMRPWPQAGALAVLLPAGAMLLTLGAGGAINAWHGARNLAAGSGSLTHCSVSAPPRMRCVDTSAAWNQRFLFAAEFLRQHAAPGEPVYVGTGRHDKIFINDVMLYFIADRPAATKWYELHPGVQTRAETQREMIEEMRRTPPRAIALETLWDNTLESNRSAHPSGAHALDDWLAECYEEKGRLETMRVLAPRAGGGARCGAVAALAAAPAASAPAAVSATAPAEAP